MFEPPLLASVLSRLCRSASSWTVKPTAPQRDAEASKD
jgi:hypothetical protein